MNMIEIYLKINICYFLSESSKLQIFSAEHKEPELPETFPHHKMDDK